MLFYKGKDNSEPRRWVLNVDEQKKILTACHSDKLDGLLVEIFEFGSHCQ